MSSKEACRVCSVLGMMTSPKRHKVFCGAHDKMLAQDVRLALFREYDPRWDRAGKLSDRYHALRSFACYRVLKELQKEEAASYLVDGMVRAQFCRHKGVGDPLLGLLTAGETEAAESVGVLVQPFAWAMPIEQVVNLVFVQFNAVKS